MIRATAVLPAGSWSGAPADRVLLDFEARHRRRVAMSAKGGVSFLLDLPVATPLRDGDGLLLEDGRIIAVEAAPEPLAEISAPDPAAFAQLAWYLGTQQIPAQFHAAHLRIRRDSVVEATLAERGMRIVVVVAPFDPEGDASGQNWRGGHSQSHGFAYSHGFHRHPGAQEQGAQGFAEAFGDAYATSRSPTHSYSAAGSHAQSPPGRDPRDPERRQAGEPGEAGDRRPD